MLSKNYRNIISTIRYSFKVSPAETIVLLIIYAFSATSTLIAGYLFKILLDRLITTDLVFWVASIPLIFYIGFQTFSKFLRVFQWAVIEYMFRWRLQDKLWLTLHKKLFSLDISHFEDSNSLNTILRAIENINWRPYQLMQNFASLFGSVVGLFVGIFAVATFGWIIPLIIIISAIPRFLLNLKFGEARWSVFDEGAESNKKMHYLSSLAMNSDNIKEIRIFKAETKILNTIQKIQQRFYGQNKAIVTKYGFSNFLASTIEFGVIGFILLKQIPEVIGGTITIGEFSFILTAVYMISSIVGDALTDLSNLREEALHVGYFFDVMNFQNCVKLPKQPKVPQSRQLAPLIEFRNVSFRYNDQAPFVLHNISFVINPGDNVALVGANGAGKTTIIKLLMRFYDVTEGAILINGEDIKNISLNWWYDQVGTLFQHFIRYNFSVKQSISLKEKVANVKRIKRAARLSGADSFIETFPKKYDQMLGLGFEEGKELSGGQWQKIALARAFYKMPPLLILDEPTSAIDAQAEYDIFKNINKIYEDEKSLLIISHRFSTVRNAEKIIVLENGRIEDVGNHQKLLEKKGLYSQMFEVQASGYK